MQNLPAIAPSMTSREIAELTGKRHDHVLRDIDNLIKTLSPELGNGFKTGSYLDGNGIERRQYVMDRDSTVCLVTGYDANARMRVIKRWQELEAQQSEPALPRDYLSALKALVVSEEQKQAALMQLESAKPAIEFHERVAESDDVHSIDEVAKILRTGPIRLRRLLKEMAIFKKDGMPFQLFIDKSYFRVIEKPIQLPFGWKLHAQTFVTAKGLIWLQHKIDRVWLATDELTN